MYNKVTENLSNIHQGWDFCLFLFRNRKILETNFLRGSLIFLFLGIKLRVEPTKEVLCVWHYKVSSVMGEYSTRHTTDRKDFFD